MTGIAENNRGDVRVELSKRVGLTAFGSASATCVWFALCVAGAGLGILPAAGIRLGLYSLPIAAAGGALVGWFTSCRRVREQVMGVWCAGALGGVVLGPLALILRGMVPRFINEAARGVVRATGFDVVGFYLGITMGIVDGDVPWSPQRENAQLELFLMFVLLAWALLANLTANMAVGVWLGVRVWRGRAATDDGAKAT